MGACRFGLASRLFAAAGCLFLILPSMAAAQRAGGSVTISLEADMTTGIDPLTLLGSISDRQVAMAVYDPLLDMDAKGHLFPNLAKSIEAAPDATSFRIVLRENVTFHDGSPLDAAAVVDHFKRLSDPKRRCRCLADLSALQAVEATGPHEVQFRMKAPSAHFPAVLADMPGMIVSPRAVEKHGQDYGDNPAGTGPFMLKEWRRGDRIVLARNPQYWKRPVLLDEIVFRPMPDEQTRFASLRAGNLDIEIGAPPRDVLAARNDKALAVIDPGSLATVFIQVNTQAADVSDRRVRRALAHALDRDSFNKVINKGLYKVANTVFGTGFSAHELVEGYPGYDPTEARKLLADYGKPVKLRLTVNASPLSGLTAQALQQMWKKVGIEIEIQPLEQVQLGKASMARDFQLMLFRWAGRADPDMNVYQYFHSSSATNRTGYRSAEMDRLLEAGRATTDAESRREVYHKVNNLLAQDLPYLLLTYFGNFTLTLKSVKGIVPVPDGIIRLDTVWKDN